MTIRATDLTYQGCYRFPGSPDAQSLTPSWSGLFKGLVFSFEGLKPAVKVWRMPTEAPGPDPTTAPPLTKVLDLGAIWQKDKHRRTDGLPSFNLIPSLQDPEVHDGQYRAQSLFWDDKQQLLGFVISPWYAHDWMPGGGGWPTLMWFDLKPMVRVNATTGALELTGEVPIVYGPFRWDVTDMCANQIVGYAPPDLQAALNLHPEVAGPGPHLLAVGHERSGLVLGTWGPGLTVLQRPNRKTPACDLRVMSASQPGADDPNPGEAAWPMLRGALVVHHPVMKMYINEPGVPRPEIRNCSPLPNPWRFRDGRIVYDPAGPLSESTWELIWGGRHQSWSSFCQRPYYRYTADGRVIGPTEPAECGRPADEVFDRPAWLDANKVPMPGGCNPYNQDAHKHNHAVLVTASGGRRSLLTQGAAFLGSRWYGEPAEFCATDAEVPMTADDGAVSVALEAGAVVTLPEHVIADRTNLLRLDLSGTGQVDIAIEWSEDDGATWEEFWSPGPKGSRRYYRYDGALGPARYNHLAPPENSRYRVRLAAVTTVDLAVGMRQFAPGGPASERFQSRYFPGQWVYDRSFGGRGFGEEARFMTFGLMTVTADTVLGRTPRARYDEEVRVADQWPGVIIDETTMPWDQRPIPIPGVAARTDIKVDVTGGYQKGNRLYLLTNDAYPVATRPDAPVDLAQVTKTGAVVNVWGVK